MTVVESIPAEAQNAEYGLDFVKLDVSHSNLEQTWQEIRFLTDLPLLTIKKKLMSHGGSDVPDMELYLTRGPGIFQKYLFQSKEM